MTSQTWRIALRDTEAHINHEKVYVTSSWEQAIREALDDVPARTEGDYSPESITLVVEREA